MSIGTEKIFIIGSLSQEEQIKNIAKTYNNAKHVARQPDKTFEQIVSEVYDDIEQADTIIVLSKPDGTFGVGVTYELEYARRLNKNIQIITDLERLG